MDVDKPMRPTTIGVVHGLALMVAVFFAAGFGHGTYTVFALAGAPLTFLLWFGGIGFWVAFLGLPALWGLFGNVVERGGSLGVAMIGIHYVSGIAMAAIQFTHDRYYFAK